MPAAERPGDRQADQRDNGTDPAPFGPARRREEPVQAQRRHPEDLEQHDHQFEDRADAPLGPDHLRLLPWALSRGGSPIMEETWREVNEETGYAVSGPI